MANYTYNIAYLPTMQLMSIKAEPFYGGIVTAFAHLQNALPSLKGRLFYGTCRCIGTETERRACVAPLVEGEFELYGLERFVVPAGNYARAVLHNWQLESPQRKAIFTDMAKQFIEDTARPQIEFYKSQTEMWLYLPIL